ncbi:hypothetical protein [Methylobacterium gregans]|uniref:Uncharacterized protein n=1 Tax=Methylobacterium gregans TaxID=374424 RepID=A0AA37HLZ4_9HYPH|nr:hypothetical protein [Methylobacterium gregans]MDQ0521956.1 hypothetical protein [Methylobacterium gregans]GJD78010.1 hypothetical protein NBEOAGPD_1222 [Methylobacterium gregans]GLS51979.1 hypothetical protein GCM10007886_01610 [Methylobacterium gregans]
MASPFDAAMAAADAVLTGLFGEQVRVLARVESEKRGFLPDPTRGEKDGVWGAFSLRAGTDRLGGTRQGTELQGMSTMAVAPAQIWFSAEELAAIGFVPRQGDLITLTDRPGEPAYAIAKRGPSDLDDATFPLTRER